MLKIVSFIFLLIASSTLAGFSNIIVTEYDELLKYCINGYDMGPFVKIGAKYYLIEGQKKNEVSWFEAAYKCRSHDAYLASIENASEMEALSYHLLAQGYTTSERFWLAENDLGNEGTFMSSKTGQPMSFGKWSTKQPDNNGNEDCVHLWLHKDSFHMNDGNCSQKALYICQLDKLQTVALTVL